MSLMIESKGRKPKTWGLDSDEPFPSVKVQDVTLLQADGEELQVILDGFLNLPMTRQDSQVWVGLFAQQIFANLNTVLSAHQQHGLSRTATGPMED